MPSVVIVSGPPTFAPPPGAVSCTDTSVFAGQFVPVTGSNVPACTVAAASIAAAAVTSVVSVAVWVPTVAVTV